MKLTFQVPDIIIDNTKSEQLVELITKASQSMDISGSVLRGQGNGHFEIYNLGNITSSVVQSVSASYPLTVNLADPIRPVIRLGNIIPAVSGGTGYSTLVSGTILVADSTSSYAQISGSTFLNNHLSAGNNIGVSVVGDRVSIALSSSLTGLGSVSASSFTGSGAALTSLTASQIGGLFQYIQNSIVGSGSITVDNNGTASLNPNVTASNYSASGYFYGDGSKLTNIDAVSIAGVVRHLSAQSPLSASVDVNGTGSIALMSQSVSYNGLAVSLGGSGSIPLVKNITTGSNNLTATSSSLSGAVTLDLATTLQGLTAVSASHFSGSFVGDGSQLTGLISSIYTSGSITGSGLTQGDAIRLKDIVNVDTLSASQVAVSGGLSVGDYVQLLPVGATNIPSNLTASYIYTSGSTNDMYFTQYQGEFTNTTRLRWLESALNTGLLHGGVITTENGTNRFSVTSGSGLIIKFNASTGSDPYPTINFVSWPAVTSASLQYSSSDSITYISIKPTDANKTIGEVRQTTTAPTFSEFKDYIVLGRVLHQSGAVTNGAINTPATAYGVNSNVADFVRAIGPLKINGHILSPSGSATLALTKTTGDSYVEGRNYSANPNIPNIITSGSDLPVTTTKIYYEYISGSKAIIDNGIAGAGHAVLTASLYQDTNGNLAAVGNSEFSVQRVFWFPKAVNNALFVYYGQAKYSNYDDAVAGISTETFVEADNTKTSAILVAYIVLRGNAANFVDPKVAKIYQAGLFRGGAGGGGGGVSGGATNLASLTDVEVGSQTDGQALVYNGSKWANGTPHNALTASIADSASLLIGFDKNDYVTTASFNIFSGSYMTGSFTGSLNGTASAALTASYVNPLTQSVYISGDLSASSGISGSFRGDGSQITGVITSSFATSSLTSSYVNPLTQSVYISGNLSASAGITGSFTGDIGEFTIDRNINHNFLGSLNTISSSSPGLEIYGNMLIGYSNQLTQTGGSAFGNIISAYETQMDMSGDTYGNVILQESNVFSGSSFQGNMFNAWSSNFSGTNWYSNYFGGYNHNIGGGGSLQANHVFGSSADINMDGGFYYNAIFGLGNKLTGSYKIQSSVIHGDNNSIYSTGSDILNNAILGKQNFSSHSDAILLGEGLVSTNVSQLVTGQYNATSSTYQFAIGNGADTDNRSNVLEVTGSSLLINGSLSASFGITGSFSGSGAGLTDLTASQIGGLTNYIHNSITGSGSISVSNGTASLNVTASVSVLTASTHVSASKYYGDGSSLSGIQTEENVYTANGITGSGTQADPFKLKDSITLVADLTASYVTASHITASFITASFFNGNGAAIIGINATSNITGKLPVNHGGTNLDAISAGSILYASSNNIYATGTLSNLNWASITAPASILLKAGDGFNTNIKGGYISSSSPAGNAYYYAGDNGDGGKGGDTYIDGGSSVSGAAGATRIATVSDHTSQLIIGRTGLATQLTGTLLAAGNLSASSGITGSFSGSGASLTNINATNISGTLAVANGGTGLNNLVSGALYIASSTSSLSAFTGSDFNLIAWDSGVGRWQSYSQPYDIAAEFSGSYASGSVLSSFKIPRNMTFTSTQESTPNFEYRINNVAFTPTANVTASASDTLTIYATSASADQYLTLLGQLR